MHRVESIMLHRSSILKMLFRHQGWILFSTYSSILLVGADNAASATNNNKCFENRNELKYAIDTCFHGGEGAVSDYGTKVEISANEADCEHTKTIYGWPMNEWCTDYVTDMHFLFSEKRDFNEDISDWNTSSCTDFYETFR